MQPTPHQFLTGISSTGTPQASQPSADDITGLAPSATTDTTNAGNITSGMLPAARLPNPTATALGGVQSVTPIPHQFLTGISTAGAPQFAQPSADDVWGLAPSATIDTTNASNITSGTLPPTTLPAPSAATLGGVSSIAPAPHQFLTGIDGTGAPSTAQPVAGDIAGLAPSATIDTTNASNITSGTLPPTTLPAPSSATLGGVSSIAPVVHQFLTGIDGTGAPSAAQPLAGDIAGLAPSATIDTTNASNITSGTLPPTTLPAPSSAALGGVNSVAPVAHQFLTGISTTGAPSAAEPVAGDIAGLAASATTDTTNAANISSGTLSAARLPTPSATALGGVQSVAPSSHMYLTGISTTGAPQIAQPSASDVLGLAPSATIDTTNASNIGSGVLAAARLPMPTTYAVGGVQAVSPIAHRWVASISNAGMPQLGQPATTDLSDIGTFSLSTTGKASLCSTSRTGGTSLDLSNCADSAMLPTGNTVQRPGSPALGMARLNTDSGQFEAYLYAHGFSSGTRSPTWSSLLNDSTGPLDVTIYPYNVVCNGATDNTAAMQSAVATGRDLYIPQFAAACVFGDVVLQNRQRIFGYGTQVQTPPGAMFAMQINGSQSISGIRFLDGATPGEMVIANTNAAASVGDTSVTTTPEAVFTATLSGAILTVSAVTSGTLTKNMILADAGALLPAGMQIVSQTSGTTGGAGTYTVNSSGNVYSAETMAGTRFQVGQRAEVQLSDGHRWGAWVSSVSETISGVTVGIGRALPAPVSSGGLVWASFGTINVTCGASLWTIKDITWGSTAWDGIVAGCPSGTANPVGMGKMYNLTVNSAIRAFFIAIGPNENSINVNEVRFNGAWTQTLNFTGNGTQTTFTGSEVMFSGKSSTTIAPTVKLNGVTQTYPAQFTVSPDGRSIVFATAPASGASIAVTENLLGSEGIVIDSTGSSVGNGANGNTVTAQGGGFEVPYGVFNAPGAAPPTNVFNNVIGDPALNAVMVFDGNQTTTVNDARLQYASKASLKILNGAKVLGDIDCNPPNDPTVLTDGGVGVCAVIDPASHYSGHLRNLSLGATEVFDTSQPIMYTGAPPPAANSGSCTVSNSGNPVPAGSYAIPCVSPSGSVTNGELWTGNTSYMPAWDTVQYYDGSANIYLTDRTTGSIPDGTVLTFAGPTQPNGAFGPITILNPTAPADNGTCSVGQVQFGSISGTTYLFVCTSKNSWKRSTLSSY